MWCNVFSSVVVVAADSGVTEYVRSHGTLNTRTGIRDKQYIHLLLLLLHERILVMDHRLT